VIPSREHTPAPPAMLEIVGKNTGSVMGEESPRANGYRQDTVEQETAIE
jgi:hypothetical protein